jgi:hypothetical protein
MIESAMPVAVEATPVAAQVVAAAYPDIAVTSAQTAASAGGVVQSAKDTISGTYEAGALVVEGGLATVGGVVAGFSILTAAAVVGSVGVVGLVSVIGYRRNWFGVRDRMADLNTRLDRQVTPPGDLPFEGYTNETVWNDDNLLETATRP